MTQFTPNPVIQPATKPGLTIDNAEWVMFFRKNRAFFDGTNTILELTAMIPETGLPVTPDTIHQDIGFDFGDYKSYSPIVPGWLPNHGGFYWAVIPGDRTSNYNTPFVGTGIRPTPYFNQEPGLAGVKDALNKNYVVVICKTDPQIIGGDLWIGGPTGDSRSWALPLDSWWGMHLRGEGIGSNWDTKKPVLSSVNPTILGLGGKPLSFPEVEPVVVPIPLPLNKDKILENPTEYMAIGYCELILPPSSIKVGRGLYSQQIPIMRNRGTLKRVGGPSALTVEIQFSLIGIDQINQVLIPLKNQFDRTPFVPVINHILNDMWNIEALTLESLSMSTVEGQPNSVAVTLVAQPFLWDFYMPETDTRFEDTWCWPLFKLWCETRSTSIPLVGNFNEDLLLGVPSQAVLEDIAKQGQPVVIPDYINHDASLAQIVGAFGADILAGAGTVLRPDVAPNQFIFTDPSGREYVITHFHSLVNIDTALNSPELYGVYTVPPRLVPQGNFQSLIGAPLDQAQKLQLQVKVRSALTDPTIVLPDLEALTLVIPRDWGGWADIAQSDKKYKDQVAQGRDRTTDKLRDEDYDLYRLSDSAVITRVSAQLGNIITDIGVQLRATPVHQFMGGVDTYLSFEGSLHSEDDVKVLNSLTERVAFLARAFKGTRFGIEYSGFLRIDNEISLLLGVTHALPLHLQIDTVPGVPGEYTFVLDVVAFDPSQRSKETLERLDDLLQQWINEAGFDVLATTDDLNHRLLRYQFFNQRIKMHELYPDMRLPTKDELSDWISKIKQRVSGKTGLTIEYPFKSAKGQKKTVFNLDFILQDFFIPEFLGEKVDGNINGVNIDDTQTVRERFQLLQPGGRWNFGFEDPDFYCVPYHKKLGLFAVEGRLPGIKGISKAKMQDMVESLLGKKDKPGSVISKLVDTHGATIYATPTTRPDESDWHSHADPDPANIALIQQELNDLKFIVGVSQQLSTQFSTQLTNVGFHFSPAEVKDIIDKHSNASLAIVRAKFGPAIDSAITKARANWAKKAAEVPDLLKVDSTLVAAILYQESNAGTDPGPTSRARNEPWDNGITNPMQLDKASDYGYDARHPDIPKNIELGVNRLFGAIAQTKGLWSGVAAYNMGEGNWAKFAQLYGTAQPLSWPIRDHGYTGSVYILYLYLQAGSTGKLNELLTQQTQKELQENTQALKDNPLSSPIVAKAVQEVKDTFPHIAGPGIQKVSPELITSLISICIGLGATAAGTVEVNGVKRYGLTLLPESAIKGGDSWKNPHDAILKAATILSTIAPQPGSFTYTTLGRDPDGQSSRIAVYLYGKDSVNSYFPPAGVQDTVKQATQYLNDHKQNTQDLGESWKRGPIEEFGLNHCFDDHINYSCEGRLVRAFPSYLVLLVDEGRWLGFERLWDHFYGGMGVSSIEVVNSRENPADVATITFSNLYGNLTSIPAELAVQKETDTRLQWSWSRVFGAFDQFIRGGVVDDVIARRWSTRLQSLMLKPGTRIHIRVGYGANASDIPVRFNGVITEVPISDGMVEVVAMGDGFELLNRIDQSILSNNPTGADDKQYYVDPGSTSFGKDPREVILELFRPDNSFFAFLTGGTTLSDNPYGICHFGDINYRILGKYEIGEIGVNTYDTSPNAEKNTSAWKDYFQFGGALSWAEGKRYILGVSIPDSSPWDVIETCKLAVPGYVAAVRPFETRSTLFYGQPNWPYFYRYRTDVSDPSIVAETWKDVESLMAPPKTFMQCHILASYQNLIRSDISASEEPPFYNNAVATGSYHAFLGSDIPLVSSTNQQVDSDIYPEHQKRLVFESGILTTTSTDLGANWNPAYVIQGALSNFFTGKPGQININPLYDNAAIQKLIDSVGNMYQGQILSIGDPTIFAYDLCYVDDAETRLRGNIRVREVVHHLSVESGYQTAVTPDCVCMAPGNVLATWFFVLGETALRMVGMRTAHIIGSNMLRVTQDSKIVSFTKDWVSAIRQAHLDTVNEIKGSKLAAIVDEQINTFLKDPEQNLAIINRLRDTLGSIEVVVKRPPTAEEIKGMVLRAATKARDEAIATGKSTAEADIAYRKAAQETEDLLIKASRFKTPARFAPIEKAYLELQIKNIRSEINSILKGTSVLKNATVVKKEADILALQNRLAVIKGDWNYFKLVNQIRSTIKSNGIITRSARKLSVGLEGGIPGLILEVVFACALGSIGDYLARYLHSRQALVVFPLRIAGHEYSAGLNGHLGAVVGDPVSTMDEWILALTDEDHAAKHFGPIGRVVPWILDFIFPGLQGSANYDNSQYDENLKTSTNAGPRDWLSWAPLVPHYLNINKRFAVNNPVAPALGNRLPPAKAGPQPGLVAFHEVGGANWSISTIRGMSRDHLWVNPHLIEDLSTACQNYAAKHGECRIGLSSVHRDISTSPTEKAKLARGRKPGRHTIGDAVDIALINGIAKGNSKWEITGNTFRKELEALGYVWITPYKKEASIGNYYSFGGDTGNAFIASEDRGHPRAIIWGCYNCNGYGDHTNHLHVSRID